MDSSGIALLVQAAARVEAISLRHVPPREFNVSFANRRYRSPLGGAMITSCAFPGAPESVPTARHFVSTAAADVPKEIADRAASMVSRTRDQRHPARRLRLRSAGRAHFRSAPVEIADSGGGSPTVRRARPLDASGRGLTHRRNTGGQVGRATLCQVGLERRFGSHSRWHRPAMPRCAPAAVASSS